VWAGVGEGKETRVSEEERDREEPSVLPGSEAMKLIGDEPEESDSPGDKSVEQPSDGDRDPKRKR
jgi:hypothetical protein